MTSHLQAPALVEAHALTPEEVLAALDSGHRGLAEDDVGRRLQQYGPNRLPEAEKDGPLKRFLLQFHDALIYVLLVAAVVTAVMQHWIDMGVILGVVIINAAIGFIQEGKAENALAGIRSMLSPTASVRRGDAWHQVPAEGLVPGDVIRLRAGDRVPADLRLLRASNLRIEEAALTGESVPAEKSTEPVPEDSGIGDRTSMAFSGTLVAAGTGTGVVTATGPDTQIGRITTMISTVETLATPLTRQMNQFGKVLSAVIVGMALLMILLGRLLHGTDWGELFLAAIGFAVAAIPEGLPAILTITLAIGVQNMARRNAITRRLNAVETLGSVTAICSDKTGTLTRNEMTVRAVVTSLGTYEVTGTGYAPEGEILRDDSPVDRITPDLAALAAVAARANDAEVRWSGDAWVLSGEPTDGGIRTFALKLGIEAAPEDRLAEVPFDSGAKYMATLDRVGDATFVHLKGAPDRLLDHCDSQGASPADPVPLDRAYWERRVDDLGAEGLRVLAAAIRRDDGATTLTTADVDRGGFTLVGLFGILDPPRPEAIAAVAACRAAGIRVTMITGDHARTATAIGNEMGIGDGGDAVSGHEIEAATDDELQEIVERAHIFARTSPEHKLRLVTALQARGHVTAMTGDGVNDAPSLKRADVGVAMGVKGTEATKEAAEIVLTDDDFTSIARAVEEGRTIYDNLRKAIIFILPTNGAEGLVMLAAVLFGLTLPLTPVQLLWVNMVTAVTLALALAFEPSERDIMRRPPRDPRAPILGATALGRIALVSILVGGATMAVFFSVADAGDLEVARTAAVTTLVFGEIFYLFNVRFLRESSLRTELFTHNPVSWVFVGVLLILQAVFVHAPFMHVLFDSAPLRPSQWAIPVLVGLAVFGLVEVEKALTRRRSPQAR